MSRANRAAVLYAPRDVRIEDRPIPELGPHDVLVELRAVGVCGSDVHYYEHGRIGQYEVRAPVVLGHESAGNVVELGNVANRHTVGDRVTLEPGIPCGRCRVCRAGQYNLCSYIEFFATPPIDGAFARYVGIHEDFAYPLPDELSDEAGALIEPLSVALWACWKGGVGAETEVLVTGGGPIGQLVAQTASALGSPRVFLSEIDRRRLDFAERHGAETIDASQVPPGRRGIEVDVFIECSGAEEALADGIETAQPGGRVVCVGMSPTSSIALPLDLIQSRELILTGTFRYANTYPAALALAISGRVDLEGLVSERFGLEQTELALRAVREDPAQIKPVVLPHIDSV
jgi:L-iditol 2-dehydrogenase